ncbi:hypothetical protein [Anabaena sp. CCY 0017]|uniref:hypothetical protein n=1 Tax=Anabaena sp. CCY 0017 TaxID=3103866 RepID=UPI0039C668A4
MVRLFTPGGDSPGCCIYSKALILSSAFFCADAINHIEKMLHCAITDENMATQNIL